MLALAAIYRLVIAVEHETLVEVEAKLDVLTCAHGYAGLHEPIAAVIEKAMAVAARKGRIELRAAAMQVVVPNRKGDLEVGLPEGNCRLQVKIKKGKSLHIARMA